jgi:hypothetical protein
LVGLASFVVVASSLGVSLVLLVRLQRRERKRQNMPMEQAREWSKRVPDKRHPQSDPLAQEEWKKNSPKSSAKSSKTGRAGKPSS